MEAYYPEIYKEVYKRRGEETLLIETAFKDKNGNWGGVVRREGRFDTHEQLLDMVCEFYEDLDVYLKKNLPETKRKRTT